MTSSSTKGEKVGNWAGRNERGRSSTTNEISLARRRLQRSVAENEKIKGDRLETDSRGNRRRVRTHHPGRGRPRPARAVLWHQPELVLGGGRPPLRPPRQPLLANPSRCRIHRATAVAVRGRHIARPRLRPDESGASGD